MSEPKGYTQAVADILNSQLGQSITQAFTAGEEQERERIIELINRFCEGRHSWGDHCTCPDLVQELKGNE